MYSIRCGRFSAAKSRYTARFASPYDVEIPAGSNDALIQDAVEQVIAAEPPQSLLVVTPAGTLSGDATG